jgi:hypothetical protein
MKIDTTTPEGKELYNKVDSFLKERIKAEELKYFIEDNYILIGSKSKDVQIIYSSAFIRELDKLIDYEYLDFKIIGDKTMVVFCLNPTGVNNFYREEYEL